MDIWKNIAPGKNASKMVSTMYDLSERADRAGDYDAEFVRLFLEKYVYLANAQKFGWIKEEDPDLMADMERWLVGQLKDDSA